MLEIHYWCYCYYFVQSLFVKCGVFWHSIKNDCSTHWKADNVNLLFVWFFDLDEVIDGSKVVVTHFLPAKIPIACIVVRINPWMFSWKPRTSVVGQPHVKTIICELVWNGFGWFIKAIKYPSLRITPATVHQQHTLLLLSIFEALYNLWMAWTRNSKEC